MAVAAFHSDRHCREGMAATCFANGQAAAQAWRFRSFGCNIIEWRWGSVCMFLQEVEPCEAALRQWWNMDSFFQGGRPYPAGGDHADGGDARPRGSKVLAFSEAVSSQTMWCYMAMLRILLAILLHLTDWVQGCPCHLNKASYNENIYGFLADMCLCNDCPLRGRRAPELAVGAIRKFLQEIAEAFFNK